MADHTLIFTHFAIKEHLYAAGFEPEQVDARFLPYWFTGKLPPSSALIRQYLRMPLAWRLLGKQFLVVGGGRAHEGRSDRRLIGGDPCPNVGEHIAGTSPGSPVGALEQPLAV